RVRLCERFGSYGMYGQKRIEEDLGHGLYQRHDAAMNYIRTGGRFGRRESFEQAAVRTNYFRETYAYDQPVVDGIEGFLWHEGFLEAARATFDCPVIAPAIVYANLLVPGQELAVHTDVPEVRGANRTKDPNGCSLSCIPPGCSRAGGSRLRPGWPGSTAAGAGTSPSIPTVPADGPRRCRLLTTPRSSSIPTACSTASIGWPRAGRRCLPSGSACA